MLDNRPIANFQYTYHDRPQNQAHSVSPNAKNNNIVSTQIVHSFHTTAPFQ